MTLLWSLRGSAATGRNSSGGHNHASDHHDCAREFFSRGLRILFDGFLSISANARKRRSGLRPARGGRHDIGGSGLQNAMHRLGATRKLHGELHAPQVPAANNSGSSRPKSGRPHKPGLNRRRSFARCRGTAAGRAAAPCRTQGREEARRGTGRGSAATGRRRLTVSATTPAIIDWTPPRCG